MFSWKVLVKMRTLRSMANDIIVGFYGVLAGRQKCVHVG